MEKMDLPSSSSVSRIVRVERVQPRGLTASSAERILDYQLQQDLNKPGCDNYDKTLGDTRWELRYLVK